MPALEKPSDNASPNPSATPPSLPSSVTTQPPNAASVNCCIIYLTVSPIQTRVITLATTLATTLAYEAISDVTSLPCTNRLNRIMEPLALGITSFLFA